MRTGVLVGVIVLALLPGCQTLLVVDEDARPVEGATVTLYRYSLSREDVGTTDERGRIRIGWGLPAVEQIDAIHGGLRGSVRGDAEPLLIILRPEEEIAERIQQRMKEEEPAPAQVQDPTVQDPTVGILEAELTGGRSHGLGTTLIVRTIGGDDLELQAGEGHRWDELIWKEGAPFVHVVRVEGDEDGWDVEDIYRFDAPTLSLGWRERVVLRKTELEERFGRGSWITQLDNVSSDGRLLLIEVGHVNARHRGKGIRYDHTIFIFDTETREFRHPVE